MSFDVLTFFLSRVHLPNLQSGHSWGDVYKKLEGTGRIVVGGRVSSVGVGGFLAYGGGYSFHSNQ